MFNKKKTDVELYQIVRDGALAGTVKDVMAKILGKQIHTVTKQIAMCEPDLGNYARLAGQLDAYQKILKTLDMSERDAKIANDKLRSVS